MHSHGPTVPGLDGLELLEDAVEGVCDLGEGELLPDADAWPSVERKIFPATAMRD